MLASEIVWLDEYERRVARDAKNGRLWLEYAEHLENDVDKFVVLSRGLRASPASAAIWEELLSLREKHKNRSDEAGIEFTKLFVDYLVQFGESPRYSWLRFFETCSNKEAYEYAVTHDKSRTAWNHYFDAFRNDKDVVERYIALSPDKLREGLEALSPEDAISLARELGTWVVWETLMVQKPFESTFEAALESVPEHDEEIFRQWATVAPSASDILLRGIEHANSLETFKGLFEQLCQVYSDNMEDIQDLKEILGLRPRLISDVAVRVDPTNPQVWIERAKVFSSAKTLEEGLEKTESDELWIALARAHAKSGNTTKMREVLKTATGKYPRNDKLWLAWIELESEIDRVVEVLETAVTKNPNSGNLATASLRLAAITETQGLLERCIRNKTLTMEGVEVAAENLKDSPEACAKVWIQGAKQFPWPEVGWLWSRAFAQLKDTDDLNRLRNLFEVAISSGPPESQIGDLYARYAEAEIKRGSLGLAKVLLDEGLRIKASPAIVALRAEISSVKEFGGFRDLLDSLDDADANDLAQLLAIDLVQRSDESAHATARAFMEFAAQFNDPETAAGREFWATWAGLGASVQPENIDEVKKRVARDFTRAAAETNQIRFVQ